MSAARVEVSHCQRSDAARPRRPSSPATLFTARTAALAALLACAGLPARAERRAALLIGENAGDQADAPLRYAEADAAAMREVLVRVGGVAPADALLLQGATAVELRSALTSLAERHAHEGLGKADRLIVYVSAHASAGELHLRGTRFPLAELRRLVDASPAGLALLILDTCEAGAAMRAKGLAPLAERVVELERPSLTGRITIASAGPEESSFESDELGGSLFTRHFIAGLRGAADASRDGRVTLQEAYAYAYARTVDSAAAVRSASQTPRFDMDLQGAGELVLSEPSLGRARLALDVEQPGEWVLASLDGGAQVGRIVKGPGRMVLALEPGSWRLRTRSGDYYSESVVKLADGGEATVTEADLTSFRLVAAGRKGTGSSTTLLGAAALGSGAVSGLGVLGGASITLQHGLDWPLGGGRPILVASVSQLTGHPTDGSFFERELALVAGGGLERPLGPLVVRAIGEGGVLLVRQQGVNDGAAVGAQPRLDAQLGVSWPVIASLRLDASVSGGGLLVHTQAGRHVQPLFVAQGGLGWTW